MNPRKPTMFARVMAALLLATTLSGIASAAASLDELLEQTRSAREHEAKLNQEREAKFISEHDKQAAMIATARAALTEQKSRSANLQSSFDGNEKKLTEMQNQLEARAGNLGEMFGVVRQVANDFSAVVSNSIISAQYPGRAEFVTKLAQSKNMPSMPDLERFWFELQREMTETGKVVKYKTQVISAKGAVGSAMVTRVGPFSATTDGQYMNYL